MCPCSPRHAQPGVRHVRFRTQSETSHQASVPQKCVDRTEGCLNWKTAARDRSGRMTGAYRSLQMQMTGRASCRCLPVLLPVAAPGSAAAPAPVQGARAHQPITLNSLKRLLTADCTTLTDLKSSSMAMRCHNAAQQLSAYDRFTRQSTCAAVHQLEQRLDGALRVVAACSRS